MLFSGFSIVPVGIWGRPRDVQIRVVLDVGTFEMNSKSSLDQMDISEIGPKHFERTSKSRCPFWRISFWTSTGRNFILGRLWDVLWPLGFYFTPMSKWDQNLSVKGLHTFFSFFLFCHHPGNILFVK